MPLSSDRSLTLENAEKTFTAENAENAEQKKGGNGNYGHGFDGGVRS